MNQQDWDRLAEKDPMKAILWRNKPWDMAEFMATGAIDIHAMMRFVRQTWAMPEEARALDFGCGIGRMTVPLSEYFKEVIAADISPTMILKATTWNGRPNIKYITHQEPNLKRWSSKSFDFILCYMTLQHMVEEQALDFMQEFIRLRSDRGVIVLQMPSAWGNGVIECQSGEMLMTRMDPTRVLNALAKRNLAIRVKPHDVNDYLYVVQGRRTYKIQQG